VKWNVGRRARSTATRGEESRVDNVTGGRNEPDLESVADRLRVVGEFLVGLADADSVRRLVRALQADEPDAFHEFIEVVPDFAGRCPTLCAVVREVVEGAEVREEERCALRPDLSLAERLLALRIYERHFGRVERVVETGISHSGLRAVGLEFIPPGPYLDELKANNLVTCWTERVLVPTWSLGLPQWECVDLCLP
jgi:hypothetical protein